MQAVLTSAHLTHGPNQSHVKEVAGAAGAFLTTPAAYVTGTSLVVDGGMLADGTQTFSELTSHNWRIA